MPLRFLSAEIEKIHFNVAAAATGPAESKDSLAVLKIKKELRRRTLIVRFAIDFGFLILMAVFFLVRAIVQNSASNQRPEFSYQHPG